MALIGVSLVMSDVERLFMCLLKGIIFNVEKALLMRNLEKIKRRM